MGNVPMSSVLGLAMMSFAALISAAGVKHYSSRIAAADPNSMTDPNSVADPGEVVAMVVGIFCAFGGALVHVVNLDMDPCLRSSAFGFMTANLGIGYMFWNGTEEHWVESMPVLVAMVFAGVVLGLLTSEGDVQKETKERWRREAGSSVRKDKSAVESKDSSQKENGGNDSSKG